MPSLLPWSFSAATVTPSGDAAAPVAAQAAQRSDCARGASVLLYWASNVPMALSAVYKESRFARRAGAVDVHVMYLTQWVSLFQFAFGFLVAPAQALPGVASLEGVPLKALALEFAKDAKGTTRTASRRDIRMLRVVGCLEASRVMTECTGLLSRGFTMRETRSGEPYAETRVLERALELCPKVPESGHTGKRSQ